MQSNEQTTRPPEIRRSWLWFVLCLSDNFTSTLSFPIPLREGGSNSGTLPQIQVPFPIVFIFDFQSKIKRETEKI
jgi:hypothetical protein